MKASIHYNGYHVELEGTKNEIKSFLDDLEPPEVTFNGSRLWEGEGSVRIGNDTIKYTRR